MIVTSTFADNRRIGPDTDLPLQGRTRKSPDREKIAFIADQLGSAPAIVKPKPKRTRKREKHIEARDPSKLKYRAPNWLDLPGVVVEGEIDENEGEIDENEGEIDENEGEIDENNERIVVQARPVFDQNPPCSKCHSSKSVTEWSYRKKARNIKDSERNTKLVLIVLIVQRYFCNSCRRPFTPRLEFLADGHLSRTQQLSDHTRRLTFQRRTTSSIAVQTGLCRRMVQQEAQAAEKTRPTPQEIFRRAVSGGKGVVIQIDDVHPAEGRVCAAITVNGQRLELLPEYSRAAIAKFLRTLDGLDFVILFIADLAKFGLQLGREICPNATVVADPYHVIRLARQAFDEFLKPFMKDILNAYISAIDENLIVRPKRRLAEKGWLEKGGRSQSNLSETDGVKEDEKKIRRRTAAEIRNLLHTKIGEMNETGKKAVRFLLERRPDVAAAYYYLQSVMHLYHVQISAAEASIKLDKFQSKLPQHVREGLSTFLTTCREDRDAICAFWSSGWTNAEMEAQSKVINQIYAAAYGCGFKELRRRWLYGESDSVILGRDKEKVLGKKEGPEKKGIREIKKMPRPEAVPIEGPGGQLSLFFEWPSQDDQASVKSEGEPVCKPPDSDS